MSENEIGSQAAELKSHAKEAIDRAGERLSDHVGKLSDFAADARYHSEDFIQMHPWGSVMVAAGFGFFVGILIARR